MKRIAAILVFFFTIAAFPIALAEVQAAVLGDGAPIPYLEGFESNIIADKEAFAGITGKIEGSYAFDYRGGADNNGSGTIILQNIAATDDFYAVFFKMVFDKSISYPQGRTQYLINEMVPPVFLLGKDGTAEFMHLTLKEAHLISDREMLCMFAVSLEKPLPIGQELTIGGIPLTLDVSRRKDSTVSCSPKLSVKSNPFATFDDRECALNTIIERVAFTPLGTRIVVNNQEIGNGTYFHYAFADSKGELMQPYTDIKRSNPSASPEHPAWTLNETWCLGGKASNAIQLVPFQNMRPTDGNGQFVHTAYIPIESLPASIPLNGGGTIQVQAFSLEEDGFLVSYTLKGYTGYISFDLAGDGNQPMHLNFVGFNSVDLNHGFLQAGGYWSSEYKGKRVARVSAQDIAKVKELCIQYDAGKYTLKPEEAVLIRLEP